MILEQILPDKNKPIEKQNLAVLIAMCIWGEARGEHWDGKIAVANVIQNRVDRHSYFGEGLREVILKHSKKGIYHFSCFNKRDPNREAMLEPLRHDTIEAWLQCFVAGFLVLTGEVPDNTNGATHYFRGRNPIWSKGMQFAKRIGHHNFYIE